jgi:hypothetical protein
MTLQNEKFEELLARQLAAELEPQRGRAVAAFKAQLAAEAAEREARVVAGGSKRMESWAQREVSRAGVWFWAGVPSLVAACLAVVLTLQLTSRPVAPGPGNELATSQPVNPPVEPRAVEGFGSGRMANDTTNWRILPQPENPYRLPQ